MNNKTYKLAILGGMGPLATNELYKRVIEASPATCDNEHIDTLILSHATLPDRSYSILNNEEEKFLTCIRKDFDLLNMIKPDRIAIPCNTAHFFYDDYLKMTEIKVLNMVEETIKLAKESYNKAYIFSTQGTYQSKVYEKYAKKYDLDILYIEDGEKDFIMDLIYEIKKVGVFESKEFNALLDKYLKDDIVGIVACTELSLLPLPDGLKSKTIDALDVLCERCVNG